MRGRPLSIRDTLLLTVGGLTLLIVLLVANGTWQAWQRLADMHALNDASRVSDSMFGAAEALAAERGIAFSMLHAPDEATMQRLRTSLESSRKDADEALQTALASLKVHDLAALAAPIASSEAQLLVVEKLRAEVDQASYLPLDKRDPALSDRWFTEVTALIMAMQDVWMTFDKQFAGIDPVRTLHMRFKHMLRTVAEYTGRERALVGRLIVENAAPTTEEQARLLDWHGKVELGWEMTRNLADLSSLSAPTVSYLEDAESHYLTVYDMVRDVFYRPGIAPETPYPIGVEFWFELSTQAIEALYDLRAAAVQEARRHVEDLESQARRSMFVRGGVLLLALALCGHTFLVLARRVLGPIETMVEALLAATAGNVSEEHDEIGKLAHVLQAFQRNTEEIKRTAEMLGHRTQALERSNKELDDFAYIASHDLKEPLRGIHNHSRFLLEENQEKIDAESAKRLGRVLYLSKRMERLVNDLLYFSRLGRQELAIQATDLNAVVHDIERTLEGTLEEKHAKILVPQSLPTITCDTVRVTELFRNLITNAIKYNDKAERLVEIGFHKTRTRPDGELANDVFYVKDNGLGIAPEFHEEVFRIFKRLQRGDGAPEDGTGVGLTFVKKIVERHGGKIWIESEPGKGTIFYFTLGGKRRDEHARAAA